jgi:hypothetical protein
VRERRQAGTGRRSERPSLSTQVLCTQYTICVLRRIHPIIGTRDERPIAAQHEKAAAAGPSAHLRLRGPARRPAAGGGRRAHFLNSYTASRRTTTGRPSCRHAPRARGCRRARPAHQVTEGANRGGAQSHDRAHRTRWRTSWQASTGRRSARTGRCSGRRGCGGEDHCVPVMAASAKM